MLSILQHMYLASQDSGYLEINWIVYNNTHSTLDSINTNYTINTNTQKYNNYNNYKKCWYYNNKERVRIYNINYRKKNLDRIRQRDRERMRKIAALKREQLYVKNDYVIFTEK